MDSLALCQLFLLISFLTLIFSAAKTKKKSLKESLVYSTAFAMLFILIASFFTLQLDILLFASLWIYPIGVAEHLKVKYRRLYTVSKILGIIWFILIMIYTIYVTILKVPILFIPTISTFTFLRTLNRYMFTYEKMQTKGVLEKFGLDWDRFKKRANFAMIPSFFPLLSFLIVYSIGRSPTITAQALDSFYSTTARFIGTFLTIIVTVSIFLISSKRGETSTHPYFLIRSLKGLCILCSVTLVVSLSGLFFTPMEGLKLDFFLKEVECIVYQSLFMIDLALVFACILYLVITFFEVVELREMPSKV